jgi:hypothetical protein
VADGVDPTACGTAALVWRRRMGQVDAECPVFAEKCINLNSTTVNSSRDEATPTTLTPAAQRAIRWPDPRDRKG